MANVIRTILSTGSKLAQSLSARALGETLTYTFQDGTEIENVRCFRMNNVTRRRYPGASIQDTIREFSIPVNVNSSIGGLWPNGNTPKNYDLIMFDGVTYWVTGADWDDLETRWKVSVMKRESIT